MTSTLTLPPETASGDALETLVHTAAEVADPIAETAAACDAARAFPTEAFDLLDEAGLMTATLPVELGGLGLGARGSRHALYRVLEEVGRGSLPVGRVYEGHVNALDLVMAYGTDEQRAHAAADARAGHIFGVWNTEAADGVHLDPLPGGGARLSGAKVFCSGVGHVTRAFANGAWPDGSWQMVLLELDDHADRADPDSWRAEGMRGSVSGRIDVEGLRVEPLALIGRPGDYTREPDFTGGSVRFAAVHLGGARALFDAAASGLRATERTTDPHQRARMGRAAIAIETGALWLLGAARLWERHEASCGDREPGEVSARYASGDASPEAVVAYAQMTRTAIERVCLDVMELVDRSVGARGLLPPSPVERIGRDLRLYLRQPAPDATLDAAGAAALEQPHLARGSAR